MITIKDEEHFPVLLSGRELATALAALRFFQERCLADGRKNPPAEIDDIATDCGSLLPLDYGQVDDLCEKLNTVTELLKAAGPAGPAERIQ